MEFLFVLLCMALAYFGYSAWKWKHREQMLRRIIQASPLPTFVIRKDHRIIYWNAAMETLSKINAEDVIGTDRQWKAFYPEQRPCVADLIVDGVIDNAPRWYSEKPRKSRLVDEAIEDVVFIPEKGDRGKWFRFVAAAIRDSRGEMFGAIETMENVTEEKLADEELKRINKYESLGTFADGVARDFDSLLSSVLRNIFLAKLSTSDEDKMMEEGLDTAEKASLQAKKLAHQLLTFARGGYALRKMESIVPLLQEAIDRCKSRSDIQWKISIPDDLWPVEMDSKQIRQVIENIVNNGLQAMPEGGTMDIGAECATIGEKNILPLKPGHYVKISIKDSGTGVSKEDLPRILDPYFTTRTTVGRKGLGLDLSICYSILKHHDGTIAVTSELGEGTTFSLFLPASADPSRKAKTGGNAGHLLDNRMTA
ncbi:MAG: PAS domain-containing protein [Deltaproteobacteria bacterium]|nr:PAS domain-containing protein [Deltaproteobacteria bacterium]